MRGLGACEVIGNAQNTIALSAQRFDFDSFDLIPVKTNVRQTEKKSLLVVVFVCEPEPLLTGTVAYLHPLI